MDDIRKNIPNEKILNLFPVNTGDKYNQYKRDALISLAFNSPEKFGNENGSFYNLLLNGNYTPEQIMDEFLTYITSNGDVYAGIIKEELRSF